MEEGRKTNRARARGALSRPAGRFQRVVTESVDDGWGVIQDDSGGRIPTIVNPEPARSVINYNQSPDVPFDRSINPYRGCEHGCVYCYARPSHAYVDLSPGLDFETRLFYKADAARILERELASPGYRCESITLGANTDPYQPVEARLKVTRSILEVLDRCRHPVSIVTKGRLIERDLDILGRLAADNLVSVMISVTSLDAGLKRSLEPRTASPRARLRLIGLLKDAGVRVGVLVAPVIPAINDHEIERILELAAEAGAENSAYILLRLPYEVAPLFEEWLEAHRPLKARHVLSLMRQSRGGRLNDPRFGHRMSGSGEFAALIRDRFQMACRRFGIRYGETLTLDKSLFRPPRDDGGQLSLLGM